MSDEPLDSIPRDMLRRSLQKLGVKYETEGVLHLDAEGLSPELIAALGEGYARNNYLVLDAAQLSPREEAPRNQTVRTLAESAMHEVSLDNLLEKAHNCVCTSTMTGSLGETSIPYLLQQLGFDIPNQAPQENGGPRLYTLIETAQGDVAKAIETIETIDSIDAKTVDILFSRVKMPQLMEDLKRAHRLFAEADEEGVPALQRELMDRYVVEQDPTATVKFENTKNEVYVLTGAGESAAIVFRKDNDYEVVKSLLSREGNVVLGNDTKEILDTLFAHGFIVYDKNRGLQRIDDIEDNLLFEFGSWLKQQSYGYTHTPQSNKAAGEKFLSKVAGMERYQLMKKYNSGHGKEAKEFKRLIGTRWSDLRDVLYKGQSPSVLPPDLQINLIFPGTESDAHTREILARVTPDDIMERFNYFRRGFYADFAKAGVERKEAMMTRLSIENKEAVARGEAFNEEASAWIREADEAIKRAKVDKAAKYAMKMDGDLSTQA